MNLNQMLSDLRAELAAVDEAIAAVGRIAHSQRRPRGRPPAWLKPSTPKPSTPKPSTPKPTEPKPEAEVPAKRKRGRPKKS
jgi:hypothetical protein